MEHWRNVLEYAWQSGTTTLYVLVLTLVAINIRQPVAMRRLMFGFVGVFILCQIGVIGSGAVQHLLDLPRVAAELRELFVLLSGIAVIALAGRTIFRVLLARLRPPRIVEDIALIIGYVIWGLVRLRYAGFDLTGIAATSAVLTAVIGFAMQDTLGNILGGLSLQFDRSVRIGEWIRIDDVIGEVTEIRWRSTMLETPDGEVVVIPNSLLVKTRFRVLGRDRGSGVRWRRRIDFEVDSGVAPDQVIAVAEGVCRTTEIANLASDPAGRCAMTGVGGLGRYALIHWVNDIEASEFVAAELRRHLVAAMARAGFKLYSPGGTDVVVADAERTRADAAASERSSKLAALRQVDVFGSLSESELDALLPHLSRAPYARGEALIRKGSEPRWLYVLTRGEVALYVESPGEPRHLLTTAVAPGLLGEYGMMTGARRAGTVIARTDVECYLLDKDGFAKVLAAKPELARLLDERIATLSSLHPRNQATATAGPAIEPVTGPVERTEDFGERVRRFFGI